MQVIDWLRAFFGLPPRKPKPPRRINVGTAIVKVLLHDGHQHTLEYDGEIRMLNAFRPGDDIIDTARYVVAKAWFERNAKNNFVYLGDGDYVPFNEVKRVTLKLIDKWIEVEA